MGLKMRHPDIAVWGEAVDEQQFRTVHAPKGWQLVPDDVVLVNDVLGVTVDSLDDLTVEQLNVLAASTGVEVGAKAPKVQLVAAIRKSEAVEAAVTPDGGPPAIAPKVPTGGDR